MSHHHGCKRHQERNMNNENHSSEGCNRRKFGPHHGFGPRSGSREYFFRPHYGRNEGHGHRGGMNRHFMSRGNHQHLHFHHHEIGSRPFGRFGDQHHGSRRSQSPAPERHHHQCHRRQSPAPERNHHQCPRRQTPAPERRHSFSFGEASTNERHCYHRKF